MVLTSGHVGCTLELGADAPVADLEGDGGDDVDIGQLDGFARENPHVANESGDEGGRRDEAQQQTKSGELGAVAALAWPRTHVHIPPEAAGSCCSSGVRSARWWAAD